MNAPKELWVVVDGSGAPAIEIGEEQARASAARWDDRHPQDAPHTVHCYSPSAQNARLQKVVERAKALEKLIRSERAATSEIQYAVADVCEAVRALESEQSGPEMMEPLGG